MPSSGKKMNEVFGYRLSYFRPIGVAVSISGLCGRESGLTMEPGGIGDI